MGITTLLTVSNGEKVSNPKSLRKVQKKLKRLQKDLSRKVKGSNNRNKDRLASRQTSRKSFKYPLRQSQKSDNEADSGKPTNRR